MTSEESLGANGRRRTPGAYLLEQLPGGGTRIVFEFSWLEVPLIGRLASPLTRALVRRADARSLQRLAETLAGNARAEKS
jgi:hypothetical protein